MHYTLRLLALFALAFALTISAHAQYTETLNIANLPGIYPGGTVTLDAAGNFYSTLTGGGTGQCYPYGCGVVYEVPAGTTSGNIIWDFSGTTDGGGPLTRLTPDGKGNLYGVGAFGGNMNACGGQGCGVVFELSPTSSGTWTETVLYAFNDIPDGSYPTGGVAFDSKGNLYGATRFNGPNSCACGIVYKLSPTSNGPWTETVLHAFSGAFDGNSPYGMVTVDAHGNVFGSTLTGGTVNTVCTHGCGVIYRLAPTTAGTYNFSRLFAFNGADGGSPNGDLVIDKSGNIYGATNSGGKTSSLCPFTYCGTVFELVKQTNGGWKQIVLHDFTGGSDGATPRDGVTLDSSGNVFGSAGYGGEQVCTGLGYPPGCGTAFEISPSSTGWTFNAIYEFTGGDGEIPNGNLVISKSGNLFGTTEVGFSGYGNIFELSPPATK